MRSWGWRISLMNCRVFSTRMVAKTAGQPSARLRSFRGLRTPFPALSNFLWIFGIPQLMSSTNSRWRFNVPWQPFQGDAGSSLLFMCKAQFSRYIRPLNWSICSSPKRMDSGCVLAECSAGRRTTLSWYRQIAPAAMIFVPSKGGMSHSPSEWTAWEDIHACANLLLRALLRRSAQSSID